MFRVLSRIYGIKEDISEAKSFKVFEEKANALIPKDQPSIFNQAIMDFGAIQCTPKKPACVLCPFSDNCFAFNNGLIHQLPVKTRKVKVKKRYFSYLVFEHNDQFLLKERGSKDIWQGLYDFPLIDTEKELNEEEVLNQVATSSSLILQNRSPLTKHVLTHRHIFARFYRLEVKDLNTFEQLKKAYYSRMYERVEIHSLPKPILIQNYLKEEVF